MPKESVLTAADKAAIKIESFVFHIIEAGRDEPVYLDEVQLTESQGRFFRDRIADAAQGTQYVFVDADNNATRASCAKIVKNQAKNFAEQSRALAASFTKLHHSAMADGVFIVASISVQATLLIALIKMDYRTVLQLEVKQTKQGAQAVLEEIVQALVEDKSALQKVALVDVSSTYAWEVLASDKKAGTGIAEYFRKFLGVQEREDASVLTRRAITAVNAWASKSRAELPSGEDPSTYKHRAYSYMQMHDNFDTDAFLDMVVKDENVKRKKEFIGSLRKALAESGVAGQRFVPKPMSLPKKDLKNKINTGTGVEIVWAGPAPAKMVEIPSSRDPNDNLYHILIKAESFTQT